MTRISINSLMGDSGPNYAEIKVAPYRKELTDAGFEQLLTADEVERSLNRKDGKIVLVVLNSVCGCSARVARPGVVLSLLNEVVPDILVTLFAGMEKEAVAHFREKYLPAYTPSSPNIALFKDGKLLHILHRYQIEGRTANEIANELRETYNKFCTKGNNKETVETLQRYLVAQYQADLPDLPTE